MRKAILAFSHFDTGGLQTYMIRVAEWCKNANIPCLILFDTIDERMKAMIHEKDILAKSGWKSKIIIREISTFICLDDDVILLNFEIPEFILFANIKRSKFRKYKIKHYLYSVSVGSLIRGRDFNGFIGLYIYIFYRKIVSKLYYNGNIRFMDEDTLSSAVEYYNLVNEDNLIMLLPMFVSPFPSDKSPNGFEIMTVSRADFPFKGYLIGLIHDFIEIAKKYELTKLKIVSFGKDIEYLKQCINESGFGDRIVLYEGLNISEIERLLKQCYVYIGMGTTVLDAANLAVPSIVVYHNTMEFKAVGFFQDNPSILGKDGRKGEGYSGKEFIDKIFNMTETEYNKMEIETYSEYSKNYNIEKHMNDLFSISLRDGRKNVTFVECYIHFLLYSLRKYRRRILNIR